MLHFSKVIEEIYQRKKCEEEDEDKMSVERWHVHLYIFRDYLMGGCHVGEARLFGGHYFANRRLVGPAFPIARHVRCIYIYNKHIV